MPKPLLKSLLMLSAVFALSSVAFAAPSAKPAVKDAALVCPVTGEKIASVKDAAGFSVYKGKKYYFCCASCKPTFDKAPKNYVKPAAKTVAAH